MMAPSRVIVSNLRFFSLLLFLALPFDVAKAAALGADFCQTENKELQYCTILVRVLLLLIATSNHSTTFLEQH